MLLPIAIAAAVQVAVDDQAKAARVEQSPVLSESPAVSQYVELIPTAVGSQPAGADGAAAAVPRAVRDLVKDVPPSLRPALVDVATEKAFGAPKVKDPTPSIPTAEDAVLTGGAASTTRNRMIIVGAGMLASFIALVIARHKSSG